MIQTKSFDFNYKQPESECYWKNDRTFLFYPCIEFMKQRINLANSARLGISVWDGGQGPYFFYHLL